MWEELVEGRAWCRDARSPTGPGAVWNKKSGMGWGMGDGSGGGGVRLARPSEVGWGLGEQDSESFIRAVAPGTVRAAHRPSQLWVSLRALRRCYT